MGNFKHGKCESATYSTWRAMKARCNRKTSAYYNYYGARGIKVCQRWNCSFSNFLEDMGEKPEGMSLERKDNSKGYSPENCCWADKFVQSRNQRLRKDSTSGFKGVNWNKRRNAWIVRIQYNNKRKDIGAFKELKEAIKARKEAEDKYWN